MRWIIREWPGPSADGLSPRMTLNTARPSTDPPMARHGQAIHGYQSPGHPRMAWVRVWPRTALMNSPEGEMPYASNLICIWHISKAIRGWLKRAGLPDGTVTRFCSPQLKEARMPKGILVRAPFCGRITDFLGLFTHRQQMPPPVGHLWRGAGSRKPEVERSKFSTEMNEHHGSGVERRNVVVVVVCLIFTIPLHVARRAMAAAAKPALRFSLGYIPTGWRMD